jgi:hypothetical protein
MTSRRLTKRDAEALLEVIDDAALLGPEVARCLGLLADPGAPVPPVPTDLGALQDLAVSLSEQRRLSPRPDAGSPCR